MIKKVLLVISVMIIIVALALFVRLGNLNFFECNEKILAKAYSKNGTKYYQIIEINCGATTPFNTIVSVTEVKKKSKDEIRKVVFSYLHERPTIIAIWKSDSELQIACEDCKKSNTVKEIKSNELVSVSYGKVIFDESRRHN